MGKRQKVAECKKKNKIFSFAHARTVPKGYAHSMKIPKTLVWSGK